MRCSSRFAHLRFIPAWEKLEDRTVPSAVNLSADLAQATANQTALATLNAQNQEFSSAGVKIAKADITVENRLVSDVTALTKQAKTTLTNQIKGFQAQLSATAASYNAEIQQFTQNFFASAAQGNFAAAQFDLAVINVLEQGVVAAVNVYAVQLTAASTNYNAVVASLNSVHDFATQNLTLDNDIIKGG